ncbi:MAG: protein kinase [Acidobacteriota bacterium]
MSLTLRCRRCGTDIPIPESARSGEDPRVICPTCHARFRLKAKPRVVGAPTPHPGLATATPRPLDPGMASTTPVGRVAPTSPTPPGPRAVPAPPSDQAATVVEPRGEARGATAPSPRNPASTPSAKRAVTSGPHRTAAVFDSDAMLADRYRIIRFLAQGGMGEVYEVEDQRLHERLALKTISSSQPGDEEKVVQRFMREIQLARRVTHPNVCRIFDLGEHTYQRPNGQSAVMTFLTMELLRGETLSSHLTRHGRFTPADALPLIEQMAAGLEAAHAEQIVHRDFKSENVFLCPLDDGSTRIKITDFGIARGGEHDHFAAQVTGAVVGTPAYMAPEQVEGKAVTTATDVYAFGIVLYEMVTGTLPFAGDSPLSIAVKRLREDPPPPRTHVPDVDPRWERVILRCLERDPAKRFRTPAEVVAALTSIPTRAQTTFLDSGPQHDDSTLAFGTPSATVAQPGAATVAQPGGATAALGGAGRATLAGAAVASGSKSKGPSRRVLLLIALLLVTLAAAFFIQQQASRDRIVMRPAVAVLGFDNTSGDPAIDWLSIGLTEMITTELGRGDTLRVVPGDTVARSRQELDITSTNNLSGEHFDSLRNLLAADYVLFGSYVGTGDDQTGELRVDINLHDLALGDGLEPVSSRGPRGELFDLVSQLGNEVRTRLGTDAASVDDDATMGLPRDTEAARLYAEGLERLRLGNPQDAKASFERAISIEGENPLLYLALSNAWQSLGHVNRSASAAKRARDLAADLGREDRLLIEARYLEATDDWPAAVEAWTTLYELFPDNLEYGLSLAAAQTSAREPQAALDTVLTLRLLPEPASDDPRLELAEMAVYGLVSDFESQLAAADRAIERASAVGAESLLARALLSRAQAARLLGKGDMAIGAAERALSIYNLLGNENGASLALISLANSHVDRDDLDRAATAYGEALERYRATGNRAGEATALNNQALVAKRRGDLTRAEMLYREAATITDEIEDDIGRANTLNNLGAVLLARDDIEEAYNNFEAARQVFAGLDNRSALAFGLNNVAVSLRLLGRLEESRVMHEQALEIRRALGHRTGEAASLHNLGEVLLDLGRLDEAQPLLEASRDLAIEIDDRTDQGRALYKLGKLHHDRGELDASFDAHEAALTIRQELDDDVVVTESMIALASLAVLRGEEGAVEQARVAVARARGQRASLEAEALAVLAEALLANGQNSAAREPAITARQLSVDSQRVPARLRVGLTSVRVATATGGNASARPWINEIENQARESGFTGLRLAATLERARLTPNNAQARELLASVASEAAIHGYGALENAATP